MPDKAFFHLSKPMTLKELAIIGECNIARGNPENILTGVSTLENASENDITFLSNKKYAHLLSASNAGACILSEKYINSAPENLALLVSADPYVSYAKIATAFYPAAKLTTEISPDATIASSAKIGKNCQISANSFICENVTLGDNTYIAPGVYIGAAVKIGDNCQIGHNVTLTHCIIGNNVIMHPGVRIGQDGFGFATQHGVHIKVPQLGRVIIEDYVEIGANSCIDRGAGPDTIIGMGTKIDNLVQIGHNVQTGKGCIIVAQVGIAGSTKLGDYVVAGGQAGFAGHLNIGSMANIAAQSGIMNDIGSKEIIGGSPGVPIKQWHRQTLALKKLVKKGQTDG